MLDAFLMWFIRPIAEFLGTLALMVGICGVLFVLLVVYNYFYFISSKPKNKQQ